MCWAHGRYIAWCIIILVDILMLFLIANFTKSLSVEQCGCVQVCSSTSFDTKVSYATYPSLEVGEILTSEKYENESNFVFLHYYVFLLSAYLLASEVVVLGTDFITEQEDPNFVKLQRYRNNHLQVDLYYDSLSFMRIKQTKKVTEVSLLSK